MTKFLMVEYFIQRRSTSYVLVYKYYTLIILLVFRTKLLRTIKTHKRTNSICFMLYCMVYGVFVCGNWIVSRWLFFAVINSVMAMLYYLVAFLLHSDPSFTFVVRLLSHTARARTIEIVLFRAFLVCSFNFKFLLCSIL